MNAKKLKFLLKNRKQATYFLFNNYINELKIREFAF